MPHEYYDENDRLYNSEQSDDESDENGDDYYDFDDDEYSNICDKYQLDTAFTDAPTYEWRSIRIGETNLRVSNEGKVNFIDVSRYYITDGHHETGTPYRYICVQVGPNEWSKYYVHDVVWRTFNEDMAIPDGWEVRHLDYTDMDDYKCYLNKVEHLDIYKKEIRTDLTLTIL
jgi:hypothetical protein